MSVDKEIAKDIAMVEWEGSEFRSSGTPYPLSILSIGMVLSEDDESITLVANLRKSTKSHFADPYQQVCIRKSQVKKIARISRDDLT